MRWFLGLLAGVALVVSGAAPASASQPAAGDRVVPPAVLVLVEGLTMDEALDAAGSRAPEVAGFVSTLAVHQPMASRVLSLAAGRRVDALHALEGDPARASGLPGPAAIERIPAEVLAWPGQEVAGLLTLGASGPATAPSPLGPSGPLPVRRDRLLVLAVPDAAALADVLGRLEPAGGAAGPVMVVGLRAAPGRANAAPLLVLGAGTAQGLPTSGSTRRLGLVALEDVRPTVAGGGSESEGDDGSVMRVVEHGDLPATVLRMDRRVAALVAARTWAIPLLCLAAVLALFALVATWRARGGEGAPRAARVLLALTWALPSRYLLASMAEPGAARLWAVAWVASGAAAAAALTALALRLDRPASGNARRVRAPVLLGAVLLGLVALDLVLGGHGLSQPLVGGSAWDGERFYGLGNGYFAFALASVMLVAGFAPLPAAAAAALLAALGVVDGLPRLGADVGGSLTSMLTAAAALVVLAPGRPRGRRAGLLAARAVAAAVAGILGDGLCRPVSHAGRFAERLRAGPGDAAGMVVDQLARNLRLLANSPFAWAGPLQILAAGLIALRPPRPLHELPEWIRRVLGLGALGSLLLILLNDTGVTATAASGLFLLAIPAWAWLDQRRPPPSPAAPPAARPAEVRR